MNKFKSLFFLLLASLCATIGLNAQNLPIDSAVKIGKLPNGLTYYIRHNNLPAHQANFYIVQKVGSVQEQESQRGLAHFLEHMCFNGTEHFPGNSLISFCERIGVKFGENLNAYTSTDETVYNINNVPVSPSNVDSCLLILHDWSHSLLLDPTEIDKERGVIHEEWRLRTGAGQRILERNLEKLYPGSRYGRRFPIGLMSVVDHFTPDTLRAYYKKWYHPDLQAIVVVGDIDVNTVENKIKELFSGIKNPEKEAKYQYYPVPKTDKAIYIIDKDKELSQSVLQAMFKHDIIPFNQRNSIFYLSYDFLTDLACNMINSRLGEMSQKPDCPFIMAAMGDGNYLISKTENAMSLTVIPKPGKSKAAFEAAMQAIETVRKYGFTESEAIRAKEDYINTLKQVYDNREKQRNSFYCPQYVRNFLEGNPILSISNRYQYYNMIANSLTKQKALAKASAEIFKHLTASTDSNFVVLGMYPDKKDIPVPTVQELKEAVQEALTARLTPYVDNVKTGPLVPKAPKAGFIKSEKPAAFGYKCWTLSNGAKVYFRKTDFDESQVNLYAHSWGGYNTLNMKNPRVRVNAQLATSVINGSGLGDFNSTQLEKALAGKNANISKNIDDDSESISGYSSPEDMRTLFEMLYLGFTKPGHDKEAYNSFITGMKSQLENIDKVPGKAFGDSVQCTLYQHDPRKKTLKAADLKLASLQLIEQIGKERFNSPSDFDFYITGNFNEDSLRAYVKEYIASIPATNVKEGPKDPEFNFPNGIVTNRFKRSMETPKGNILQFWHGNIPYSLKEAEIINAFGAVLNQRLLNSIREEHSLAYSCGASANAKKRYKSRYLVQIYCPVKPAKADSALLLMKQAIQNIADKGVTNEELNKFKQYQLKQYMDNQKNNDYWENLIVEKNNWGVDDYKDYQKIIKEISAKDVQNFCKNVLLKQDNSTTVIMLPTSLKETEQ